MILQKFRNNHLLMSGLYKGVSGLSLFVSIPLLIKYFGQTNYGLWVLVFALFQWVFSMDFGLASVLKTKIPVLIQENKIDEIKNYIKSTYRLTIVISLFIFISFLILVNLIDLKTFFKIPDFSTNFITNLFLINIFFFCLNFILNVQKSLFVAFLKGKYSEQSIAINQILFLIVLVLIIYFEPNLNNKQKLISISLANGVVGLIVNGLYTFYFFYLEKITLKSNLEHTNRFVKELIGLGLKYMMIQIGLLFIFTIDNYILSNVFGPKDIVPYEVVNKLFQLPVMIILAALSPLWSMFANDYNDKNYLVLLSKFKKFNITFLGILFFIVLIALFCPFIIPIWIHNEIIIPENLILYMSIVTALRIFVSFYSFFLYGVEKINNYIIILIISVVIKIPLTYFFIHLNFGINSVILSTLFIMILWIISIPFECYRIIKKLKK